MQVLYQINEYIFEMGENFDSIMDSYFETFKEKMNNRFKIPKKLVSDYRDDWLVITMMMYVLWLIMIMCIYKKSNQELYGLSP